MSSRIFPTPQDAETAFYEALERNDLDLMMSVWSEDEEVVCAHPGGPRIAGLEQVRESWRRMFSGGATLRVHLTQQVALTSMIVAVHSLHENITVGGESAPRGPMLATNVYQRSPAGWRMILHHSSPAPAQADATREIPKTLH